MNKKRVILFVVAGVLVIAALVVLFWEHISLIIFPRQEVLKPTEPPATTTAAPILTLTPSPTAEPTPTPTPEPTPTPVPVRMEKYDDLYERNNDLVGWVTIEGTEVDYAVVQRAGDNNYYLDHNFDLKSDAQGYPYLDIGGDILNNKRNLVLHGHSLKNGKMFTAIKKYGSLSYYKEHPVILFDTLYEECVYKIFAAIIIDASPTDESLFYFPFNNFQTEEKFMSFVTHIQHRSLINTTVDVVEGDELLMLSTCTYEIDNARFVLIGRKVREGESAEVDVDGAVMNPDPQMPAAYYKKYGGTMPTFD